MSWIGLGIVVGWTLPCPPGSSPLAQGIAGAIVLAILGTVLARCGASSSQAWFGAGAGVMVAAVWGIFSPAGTSRLDVCLSLIAGGLVASLAGVRITAFVRAARSLISFRPL